MSNTVNIRPFKPSDQDELVKNASEDGHSVYYPSCVIEKDGRIVGYFSVAVPMVLSWQDSQRMKPLDSVKELGTIEGVLINQPMVCIPCDPDSPFVSFLPKQGYELYFKPVNLYIKRR